jgi:hypothetical protein
MLQNLVILCLTFETTFENMEFLLKIVYYALLAITTLLDVFYFGATLLGLVDPTAVGKKQEDLFMLAATAVSLAILYKAYTAGHVQGNWGTGIWLVVGAIVSFIVIYVGGMLMFGNPRWQ